MHLSTQHVYRLSCQCYVVVISPWHTHLKNPIIRHVALTRCRHRYRMWNSLDNKDFSVHFVPTGILLQLTTIRTLHSESLPLLWHLGSESRTVKFVHASLMVNICQRMLMYSGEQTAPQKVHYVYFQNAFLAKIKFLSYVHHLHHSLTFSITWHFTMVFWLCFCARTRILNWPDCIEMGF